MYTAFFSSVLFTLSNAFDTEYLTTWSEPTSALLCKHPPQSQAMVGDHLHQQHMITATSRSYSSRQIQLPTNHISLFHADRQSLSLSQRTSTAYTTILSFKQHTHSDQKGKFLGNEGKTTNTSSFCTTIIVSLLIRNPFLVVGHCHQTSVLKVIGELSSVRHTNEVIHLGQ